MCTTPMRSQLRCSSRLRAIMRTSLGGMRPHSQISRTWGKWGPRPLPPRELLVPVRPPVRSLFSCPTAQVALTSGNVGYKVDKKEATSTEVKTYV